MIIKINRLQKKDFTLKDILFVPYGKFYYVLNLSEVIYIKAEKSYCKIAMRNGNEYIVAKHIKLFQASLPLTFIRIHNSYLVNIMHAESIHNGSVLKLNNDFEIPISRRKKKELFEAVIKM
jgi:two-component system, LytTR family, response regulator